jgi:hypothetical protein
MLFCILSCIFCIFLYILFCMFCILFCILFCIFCILCSANILCILCILFCILVHIYLHIILHILHILIHIILHFMHIVLDIILHILHSVRKSHGSLSSDSLFLPLLFGSTTSTCPAVDVHHLQPSLLPFDLSQTAPGKSADSLRMSNGIVPVWRELSQYAGHWNDIQHLCSFFVLVHDGGLTSTSAILTHTLSWYIQVYTELY